MLEYPRTKCTDNEGDYIKKKMKIGLISQAPPWWGLQGFKWSIYVYLYGIENIKQLLILVMMYYFITGSSSSISEVLAIISIVTIFVQPSKLFIRFVSKA